MTKGHCSAGAGLVYPGGPRQALKGGADSTVETRRRKTRRGGPPPGIMEGMLSEATPHSTTRTAAVVFAGFCAFVTLFAPQPLLPLLAREFRVSAAAIRLVVTASTRAVAFAAPFAGVVARRFGRERVIVPAAFLVAVPTVLAATATTFGQLLFWRFLQGIFTPGIFAVIIAYIDRQS